MQINGETHIIGFFGSTYKTSKMYAMYNAAFDALGLSYIYIPFAVNNLDRAVEGIRHLGIKAVGVTIPYKTDIIQYLDDLSAEAKGVGAVNVVLNDNGKLIGANTDGLGAMKALEEVTNVKGKKVVLLGAGGAARAIAFAVKGKQGRLCILNRTNDSAKTLADAVDCTYTDFAQREQAIQDADILINATSVGMFPTIGDSLVSKHLLRSDMIVMDIISHPKETKLLKEAKEAGCSLIYGNRMLLWQGVLKFMLYTGVEPPLAVMEKALQS